MSSLDYQRPNTLADALRAKADAPTARFIAGGTDVMVRLREGRLKPPALISLRGVSELSGITPPSTDAPHTRVGAAVTVRDLLDDEATCSRYPALAEAARRLGSPQVRNAATVGGNLCNASPCADLAPPLLVYGAHVVIRGLDDAREVPLHEFFVQPGETRVGPTEIVSEIVIPTPAATTGACFHKMGRVAMDIAIASVAVLVEFDGTRCTRARLAAGSVGPRPMRLHAAEAALEGRELSAETIEAACRAAEAEVSPISDVRGSERYRRRVVAAFTKRGLEALGREASEVRS